MLVAEKGASVKVGDNSIQGDDSVTYSIESGEILVRKLIPRLIQLKRESLETLSIITFLMRVTNVSL